MHNRTSNTITTSNKFACNLQDLLSYLTSEHYNADKKVLDDTYVVLDDNWILFEEAIIKIENVDWGHDSAKYHDKFVIYWGKITNACCLDSENRKYPINDIQNADNYRLIINFGNKQSRKPSVIVDEEATKLFIQKYHKVDKNDIIGTCAIHPDQISRKFSGLNFRITLKRNMIAIERRNKSEKNYIHKERRKKSEKPALNYLKSA